MDNALEEMKFILYHTENENVSVNALIKNETIWLTQQAMAELFNVDRTSITKHLNNIFKEDELNEQEVCEKIAHTTKHGFIEGKTQTKEVNFYNLDAIIAVGYRVNSKRATKFRIWATNNRYLR